MTFMISLLMRLRRLSARIDISAWMVRLEKMPWKSEVASSVTAATMTSRMAVLVDFPKESRLMKSLNLMGCLQSYNYF